LNIYRSIELTQMIFILLVIEKLIHLHFFLLGILSQEKVLTT